MSESNKSKDAPEGRPSGKRKKEFIRETIEERKPSRKKWIRRGILLVVLAIVFGLIAALTFVLTEPWLRSVMETEEETRESVQIPRDSLEPETSAASETEESETEPAVLDEEALRESVESIVEKYLATWDSSEEGSDYTELARDMSASLRPGMVTVTSRKAGEDIFEQQYVRSQETFGLILTVTSSDILILTETSLLEETEDVTVTLGNRSKYDAGLVAMDATTGIAVVSISVAEMEETDLSYIEPVTLGNSYSCQAGDTVVALGNPMGYVPSVAWGIISYIDTSKQGIDMNFQLIQTDIAGSSEGTGVLVNLNGQVVGWITQSYGSSDSRNMLAAISISDIKSYIEGISNGQSLASLGVQVQVVTSSIAEEQELPVGLYISNCVSEGAAYNAGLQNGDILVAVDGERVENMSAFQNVLMACAPGDTVSVTVMRSSKNGYVEQSFQVKLDER